MGKPQVILGIDPGDKGAICALRTDTYQTLFMPTTLHPTVLMEWFRQLEDEANIRSVFVEQVSSIRGASAGSNYKFGYNVGTIDTFAALTGCMVEKVAPKVWQKYIGVKQQKLSTASQTSRARKLAIAAAAERLYPGSIKDLYGPKGGLLDGRSDALMIAHYGMKTSIQS